MNKHISSQVDFVHSPVEEGESRLAAKFHHGCTNLILSGSVVLAQL